MSKVFSPTPRIVGIAGGSGSGKTELARRLVRNLGKRAVLISHDWYYRDRSKVRAGAKKKINFDHPSAFETPLLLKHLQALKARRGIETPRYDYASHRRLKQTVEMAAADIILIEGLFVLHDIRLRELLDLSVFVDVPADIRLIRRIRRDATARGIAVEETLRLYENFVRPMHERYVQPSAQHATHVWNALFDRGFPEKLKNELRRTAP